jgi:2-dehydro-3-deoxygluconokinase
MPLSIKPKDACRWDLISLGEVMLRFDPGEYRIWTARDFRVSEGGGEYYSVPGLDQHLSILNPDGFKQMMRKVVQDFSFQVTATTLRRATTATRNDWGAICYSEGDFFQATTRENLEILDRVGGGDSFASGLIYGFLSGKGPQWAVECGAAHGALAMTTPGDTSMATLDEVLQVMKGAGARIVR